ncbi:(Fe-S)-binding protein [Dethiosulfatarculus sandiegensis]|uniref:Glycolate oxidase iron-sulfur subunit n=1 Tax=Dethiosulfatarculus sandiegensis TaxID=1429043 RepID=A0A0D2JBV1_9BACT|nr:(Fe-S)-binding protein [Dethiosulfatarculus sandiegensis]KIX13261.1 hypothetical protein X474_14775 [Dethiosulfatarculus sandiegensis]
MTGAANPRESDDFRQALDSCVSCGSCQSVCPVYKVSRQEELVARGKLMLLKGYEKGFLKADSQLLEIISRCLLCGRCTDNCTNKVRAMEALREARARLARETGLPFVKRLMIEQVIPKSERLDKLVRLGYLGHPLFKGLLSAQSGLNLSLPGTEGLEKLPRAAGHSYLSLAPRVVQGPKGAPKVAFFVGCMANYLRPELAEKAVALLSRRFTVFIPPDQGCCGLPAVSAGLTLSARELVAGNLEALNRGEPDLIITTCGSCAFALAREIPRLAPETDRKSASLLSAKVREISQVLAEEPGLVQGLARPKGPVAVHDPCHLKLGLSVSEEPREMLKAAGAELVPMQGQDECCGGGGLLPANEPDLAGRIFAPRKEAFAKSGASVLATSCSGCFAQWRRGLDQGTPVVHPLELLTL